METGYVTRTMSRDEVALAVDWAAQEGWNPGLHDAQTFRVADPGGANGLCTGPYAGQHRLSVYV